MVHNGGYADYALCDAYRVFPIPDRMSYSEAASLPIVYHTSYFALNTRAQLRAGEWLLVHAGASGVGMSAIQIGKAMGARVIATAGSAAKLEFCRRQGAEHALAYDTPAWAEEVKRITGRGADVIYDPVGGDVFDLSTRCIAPDGRLLVIGFTSGRIPTVAVNRVLLKNISIVGVHWGASAAAREGVMGEAQAALERMYMEGKIQPAVGKEYPLAGAKSALADVAARRLMGKAVLLCG
jgi:NADPH2:quinone reductase